jgi:hypothetical protein
VRNVCLPKARNGSCLASTCGTPLGAHLTVGATKTRGAAEPVDGGNQWRLPRGNLLAGTLIAGNHRKLFASVGIFPERWR